MSANEIVLQKLDQGLLTITMNRPDRRNALNPDMTLGLVAAARRAAEDHEVLRQRLGRVGRRERLVDFDSSIADVAQSIAGILPQTAYQETANARRH